jgi:hypothetical protein
MIQIQISNVVNLESHFSCQYGAPDFTLFIRGEGEIREIYFSVHCFLDRCLHFCPFFLWLLYCASVVDLQLLISPKLTLMLYYSTKNLWHLKTFRVIFTAIINVLQQFLVIPNQQMKTPTELKWKRGLADQKIFSLGVSNSCNYQFLKMKMQT